MIVQIKELKERMFVLQIVNDMEGEKDRLKGAIFNDFFYFLSKHTKSDGK